MKEAKPSAISALTAARLPNAQVNPKPVILRLVSDDSAPNLALPAASAPLHLAGRHAELITLASGISEALSVPPPERTPATGPQRRRAHARVSLENIRAAGTAISDRRFAEEVSRLNKATILSLRAYEHHCLHL